MGPRIFALCNAIVRSISLFSYPLFGWLVDNIYVDGQGILRGRRRPVLFICAPLIAASLFLLYATPALPASQLEIWYVIIAIIYNAVPLSLTYYSLGTELTSDYDEQSSIFGYLHILASLGMIAGSLLPGWIASLHIVSHNVLFPLVALVISLIIAGTVMLLAARTKVPNPWTRLRPDDGGMCKYA
jgi:Na+/melibiose symporter-like transporter